MMVLPSVNIVSFLNKFCCCGSTRVPWLERCWSRVGTSVGPKSENAILAVSGVKVFGRPVFQRGESLGDPHGTHNNIQPTFETMAAASPPLVAKTPFDLDLERFTAFWTAPHSLVRSDAALAASSLSGHIKRIHQYRRYLESTLTTPVASLNDLCADLDRFVAFLDTFGNKTAGTRARCVSFSISVLRSTDG